ncbi:MAG: hypothetical protein K5798_03640 [Nitrosopumilus sp.]|uniref:hypothetical protein n=1 Tax=Nitrosopumilus sp. TaxID=2024843 RepID=UPI00242A97CD|nr:hypothetical protein [Nitrosopumilus sp.]MCV0366345.1 hypothetical protein [Nitrosopumilus sp.]
MKYMIILLMLIGFFAVIPSFAVPYSPLDIAEFVGLNDTYALGEEFEIRFEKMTRQPCPSYQISLMKEEFPESKITYGREPLCATTEPVEPYLFNDEFSKPEFFDTIGTYIVELKIDETTLLKKIEISDDVQPDIAEYRFVDFSYHNYFGEPITFILEKTAKDQCNSFVAEIIDENGKVVWTQRMISSCITSTDPEPQTSQIKLGFKPHNKITLTDYGKYFLKIQIDGKTIETEFLLRAKSSGISFDRTVSSVPRMIDSPLKQIQNGIYGQEIVCREDRVLVLKKSSEFHSCITADTVPKLFARGWALNEVRVIDTDKEEHGESIKITGIIDRRNTVEGFEYHLIPLREELPRIEYTGYNTLNLFSTKDTVHHFLRNLEGTLVKVEGRFLLDDGEYFRHFSGFPTIPVQKLEVISESENLEYSIEGAELLSITKIPDAITLNIVLLEAQNGVLEITIPRELMDAKIGMTDDDFFVLVDGEEVNFDEKRNDDERRLTIAFKENTTTIQVIGAFPR